MKLLLHIGTEKTGTTLLQQWLYHNKHALSKQGVFLSKVCGFGNNRKLVSFCQTILDDYSQMEKLQSMEEKALFFQSFAEDFRAEVAEGAKDHKIMVITSEHFHSRIKTSQELESLSVLLEDIFESVKVICYLRPQWDLRESLYSTSVKGRNASSLEQFQRDIDTEDHYYNYFNLVNFWAGAFGKDNIDLRLFDRSKFAQGDLRKDFLTALPIEIDQSELSFEIESANESLTFLKSCAYRGVNRSIPYQKEAGDINPANMQWKKTLFECGALDQGKLLDPGREDFFRQFEESNRRLAEAYFHDRDVFPKPEKRHKEETVFTLEDVGKIVEDIAATTAADFAAVYESAKVPDDGLQIESPLNAKLKAAIRERDHARRYPWKYLVSSLKARLKGN